MENKDLNKIKDKDKVPTMFESADKFQNIIKKVDTAKRNEKMKMVETLNFLEDPQYIK